MIYLLRANQSQAKFKSAAGGNLLQSWVILTIVLCTPCNQMKKFFFLSFFLLHYLTFVCVALLILCILSRLCHFVSLNEHKRCESITCIFFFFF